jgi:hypothetical protein
MGIQDIREGKVEKKNYAGIDVSKDTLDVTVHGDQRRWSVDSHSK